MRSTQTEAAGFVGKFLYVLRGHRWQLGLMMAAFIALSAMDVLGIGLVGPFVAAVIEPARLERLPTLTGTLQLIARPLNIDVRIALGLALLVIFAFKGVLAYLIHRRVLAFAFSVRAALIKRLTRAYMAMPYQYFLQRNSASLVQSTVADTKVLSDDLLIPTMRSVSDGLVLLLVGTFLFLLNAKIMLVLVVLLSVSIWLYSRLVRPRTRAAGQQVALANEGIIRGVNQLAAGLKDIRVLGVEDTFVREIEVAADANAGAQLHFYSSLAIPRYLMESVMVIFVVALALYTITVGTRASDLMATLAIFAVAGLRALPAVTQISSTLAGIHYSSHALTSLYALLRDVASTVGSQKTVVQATHVAFKQLRFDEVNFRYSSAAELALSSVSLTIERGASVGLIGESGSGKTTLVDLLLALHEPQSGRVLLNGESVANGGLADLRRLVAYIPQTVFIVDDTLRHNIALGVPDAAIDDARLADALFMAKLDGLVARLPEGLETLVGERGGRLSGGERQRIALARAFYHDREVIIFDEATSALDAETEREVIAAVERLHGKKTLIVIAHRRAALSQCDVIYRLERGRIVEMGTPAVVLPESMA